MKVTIKKLSLVFLLFVFPVFITSCVPAADKPRPAPYRITGSIPHSPQSFTQGLEFLTDKVLAESSGRTGRSAVTLYTLDGNIVQEKKLSKEYFGEGLTRVGDTLYQLTWKHGVAFKWDSETLAPLGTELYYGEGWGLCYDEVEQLIWKSDGTNTLQGHSPEDFTVLKKLEITTSKKYKVNELECVRGKILANDWTQDYFLVISKDGTVKEVSLTPILEKLKEDFPEFKPNRDQVLNGLAWHKESETLYATGKEWPATYMLEFHDSSWLE